ncbi:hypothetical protein TCAL_05624, partial [Tigriopus californicus]|eukprot:TCALIF_05624-PA protein Name:"Similar to Arhgdib Rho GDP-dissociation inhibitor 2 (Mus musculus)" AED:0.06 eAED:0.07 QI:1/0/0/1/0/0/2/0/190
MSQPDAAGAGAPVDEVDVADEVAGYKPPKEKTLEQILQADEDDAALKRYKATLLGAASEGAAVVLVEPDNPSNVIVKKLFLVVEGRPDTFTIKEGIQFRIRIEFIVQREIVTGLKYVQKTSRMGVTVDKMSHMVGSYGPKTELQSYTTPVEDAPTGMTGRGTYHVHSLFSDDDKKEYLKWDWSIDIKKDW